MAKTFGTMGLGWKTWGGLEPMQHNPLLGVIGGIPIQTMLANCMIPVELAAACLVSLMY